MKPYRIRHAYESDANNQRTNTFYIFFCKDNTSRTQSSLLGIAEAKLILCKGILLLSH